LLILFRVTCGFFSWRLLTFGFFFICNGKVMETEGFCAYLGGAHSPALLAVEALLPKALREAAFFPVFFFAAGASQVKWNKKNANCLATSHDGDVRIWDKRVSDLIFPTFGFWSLPEGMKKMLCLMPVILGTQEAEIRRISV
jgi:hypothetical protein